MSILLSLLLLFQPNWDTDPDLWGIGSLQFKQVVEHYVSNYQLPYDQKFPYFDTPNGKFAGYLIHQSHTEDYNRELSVFSLLEERQAIDRKDMRETAYESRSLLVFERRGNWVKVLHHTTNGGKWLNLEALKAHGLYYKDWLQFLIENRNSYNPPQDFGLNMRKGAGTSFERIATLRGENFFIELTGKTASGTWAEAEVVEYNKHPCDDGKLTGRKWTGWIKVLDDKGYPNIWYYTRGC